MFWQSGKKRYDKINRYLPALQILLSAGMKIDGHNPAVINRKVFQDISPIALKNAPNRRMGEINRLKCQRCEKKWGQVYSLPRLEAIQRFDGRRCKNLDWIHSTHPCILGHENRTTTEIYLRSVGEGERHAMDILDDGFRNFSHTDSHTEKKGLQR